MLSIAEYAKTRHVSQTAVRRQLVTYSEELEGHIVETSRRKLLDDDAVAFLDAHRLQREVIVQQADKEAQREIQELRGRLDLMKDKMLALQETIIDLQGQSTELLADQARSQLLIETRDNEVEALKAQLQDARAEADSYRKTIFGFLYWKKNK